MLMWKRRTQRQGHGDNDKDSFNGGDRARGPRDCFWLVVPVWTGCIPPGALEACENSMDCPLASPDGPGSCPALLSPFPVEGRGWVTSLKGPGE